MSYKTGMIVGFVGGASAGFFGAKLANLSMTNRVVLGLAGGAAGAVLFQIMVGV